jgi:hypothetical protein
MLPFLKDKKRISQIIIDKRKSTGEQAPPSETTLESHVEALISAIHNKDKAGAASALKEAVECINAPYEEQE